MRTTLLIGAGGVLGALARYGLGGLVQRVAGGAFPAGTLAVNVLGCFAIGIVMYLTEDRPLLAPSARLFLAIGFLGSFTTFSTFGYETVAMLRERDAAAAVLNVGASMGLGLLAVVLGRAAAQLVWR
jgi:CrcB protein